MSVVASSLAEERPAIGRALAAGLVVTVSTVGLAATSGWLIVRAAQRPAILSLTVPMGLVQLFALAKAAGRYAERTATHRAALSVMGRVRARVARTLEPLVPAGLGPRSADVVDLAIRDVDRVQDLLTAVAAPLAVGLVAALGSAVLCGLLAAWSGVTLGAALALTTGAALLGAGLGAPDESDRDLARAQLVELVEEVARDPDAAALGGGFAALAPRLKARERAIDRSARSSARRRGAVTGSVVAVSGAAVAAALVATAGAMRGGHLAAALVAVPALVTIAALDLVGGVGAAVVGWGGDRAAMGRLEALGHVAAPVREPDSAASVASGHVVADRLGVAYDEAVVLEDASIEVRPGDVVLVRGPSGGGKTTLAWALAKFLVPTGGVVTLGGVDYATLSSSTVRASVCFVDDAPYVFATSLAANLRVASPDATDAELADALASVGLAALLERPFGLEGALGGAGSGLSGGERIRLGVARAVLAGRRVTILDEPTEALDLVSARRVLEAVTRDRGRAVVIVSHRFADESFATRVVTLEHGVTARVDGPSMQ